MTSRKDRTDIGALHGLSGVSSVSEHNTSTSVLPRAQILRLTAFISSWKKPPTVIMAPQPGGRKDIQFHNPFGSTFTTNVGDAKKRNAKGPATKQGVAARAQSREAKRPRLSSAGSVQNAIDLTGDTIDSNNLVNAPGPSRAPHTASKKPRPLSLAKDGPNTQRLERRTDLSEDEIEMGSPPSPAPLNEGTGFHSGAKSGSKSGNGIVQKNIALYDALSGSTLPLKQEDLRKRTHPLKPLSRHAGPPELSPRPDEMKISGAKRKREFELPVRGCIVKEGKVTRASGKPLTVAFEGNTLRAFGDDGTDFLSIDLRQTKYAECLATKFSDSMKTALVLLQAPEKGQSAYEMIALLIDCEHNDWTPEAYREFKVWLKPHAEPPDSTVEGLWERLKSEADASLKHEPIRRGLEDQSTTVGSVPGNDKNSTTVRSTGTPIPVPQRGKHRELLGNVNPSRNSVVFRSASGSAQASSAKAVPNTATSPEVLKTELLPPLRRSGRQAATAPPRNPTDDEIILVFPPDAPGKVTITNADVARLKPGEFLNDTLIEFGLKLWLKTLEDENPGLAKQVHVFSSFFYKKLNKRNIQEGYNSVRKWTSKFDLFDKKYIIVPINENMHWYLAVIYEPEHVIRPPPPEPTPPPGATKRSGEPAAGDGSVVVIPDEESANEAVPSTTPSEAGIEEDLTANLTQCSIASDGEGRENSVQEVEVMVIDPPKTPTVDLRNGSRPPSPMCLSPEIPVYESAAKGKSAGTSKSSSTNGDEPDVLNIVEEGIPVDDVPDLEIAPEQFYGTVSTRSGKQYEKPQKAAGRTNRSELKPKATFRPNHTYILTMDSLGSKHLHACKQLAKYLELEAKDKKNVVSTADIQLKQVNVPTQPNFCDCGLYLLHLAQTFISDAENLLRKDFETTARTPNSERQELWRDSEVPHMRQKLLSRIESLSRLWKESQNPSSKAKEDAPAKTKGDDSDSDIDIVEIGPVVKTKGKAPAKQAAMRLR
ncbi:hypothetical protein NMY22_g9899 [Coprinellus aureogranulatus]|nr:hypothetical protein NMY22_g9899 [Coprinellus aureogranulatus]